MRTLAEIDTSWRQRLQRSECPPLLGLAPLSQEECEEIKNAIEVSLAGQSPRPNHRVQGIIWLLALYPGAVAVWLSRLAGEVYDAGNFWDRLATSLGCQDVPINLRGKFALQFCHACRGTMASFVQPEIRGFRYIGEFLFQAGLPLCHCDRFTAALRAVADSYGMPEPDDTDGLRDFREAMLGRSEVRQAPVVRLALEVESGLHLLGVAFRVVREDDFVAINPELGQRLRESFLTSNVSLRSPAVRWPWLQLDQGLTSFSVVGPRQPSALLAGTGVKWVVNGTPHRVGTEDEFVFPVDRQRLRVELIGLAGDRALYRDFALHIDKESTVAFVFSGSGRRLRAIAHKSCHLEAGDYWLVHPAEFVLDDVTESYAWLKGPSGMQPLTTSRLTLRPGTVPVLRDGWGEPLCEFRPKARPFIEIPGERIWDAEEQCIHFGWSTLPRVWVPADEEDQIWALHLSFAQEEHEYPLVPVTGQDRDILRKFYSIGGDSILSELPPALYSVSVEVRRNGRRVNELSLLLWHGLEAIDSEGFHCRLVPANIVQAQSRGFLLDGRILRHVDDKLAQHKLTFRLGQERRTFAWRRPGVFIESFQKIPGEPVQPRQHRLGESFSFAVGSRQWLRVWLVPTADAAVLFNGREVFRFFAGSERQSMEFSLAQFAAQDMQGGRLVLHQGGAEVPLARFTRPLVPVVSQFSTDQEYETLLCKFTDRVGCVRVSLREVISGRDIRFPGREFTTSGHLLFQQPGLPRIEVSNIAKDGSCSGELHRLQLDVPQKGWPAGLWVIEMEISREPFEDYRPLVNARAGRLPIVLVRPSHRDDSAPYRTRCLRAVLVPPAPGTDQYFPTSQGHERELAELLGEVRGWLGERFEDEAWTKLRPLQVLSSQLAKQAKWQIGHNPATILPRLVEQLAEESDILGARSLIVQIPDLLATPAELCGKLPASDPIRGGLRWAAGLATADGVTNAFRRVRPDEPFGLGESSREAPILREFKNSRTALEIGQSCSSGAKLNGFKFAKWFGRMSRETTGVLETNYDEVEALSPEHWRWAMHRFLDRRRVPDEEKLWADTNAVFAHSKADWLFEMRLKCPPIVHVFPAPVSGRAWWDCEEGNDFLTSELVDFSALLALGARASSRYWLSFWDVLKPLREEYGVKPVQKALTTLLTQAPEILGFQLMFWELMIKTYPHD